MAEPDAAAWTIDQLSQLVAEALSAHDPGQSNGRVRQVPDVRTIRWYTSIGLLDRPAAMRGRTALYGRRHLAQIVAVKRLQADGLALADVQQQLIGADDAALERIARLGELPASPDPSHDAAAPEDAAAPGRGRFWSARPLQASAPRATAGPNAATGNTLIHGIRLAPGVSLLLDAAAAAPDDEALAVIAQAAQPLLDALAALGLSHDQQRRTGQQPSEGGQSR
ncbi:MerR family transcriptional regulator [Actinospica robiniae]|uniref:helix-turn-helix domain-containing protein n=1 Tax=Actinospica robiniae TaxID=304901 RepID=UPI00041A7C70|nr:MerR family transcriptional regulator [Actinospica robiniae]